MKLPLTIAGFYLFGLSASIAQQAGATDLTLSNALADNLFDVSIGASGFSDTQETRISGNVLAQLNVDPATGQVSEITFTGGNLSATDMSFILAGGFASASTSGLQGTLSTPNPPGTVTPATGAFLGTQHRLTFNQGSIVGNALGQTFDEDFSTSPTDLDGSGTGTVTLTETSRTATRIFYDAALEIPISDTSTTDANGTTISFSASGSIKASGQLFIFRSAYLEWTESTANPGASFSSAFEPEDWANGLVWAMRSSRKPWAPQASGNWSLALPAEGTRGELIVEQSTNLITWISASAAQLVGGLTSFPPGSTGTIELIPQDTSTYFRIRAIEP